MNTGSQGAWGMSELSSEGHVPIPTHSSCPAGHRQQWRQSPVYLLSGQVGATEKRAVEGGFRFK